MKRVFCNKWMARHQSAIRHTAKGGNADLFDRHFSRVWQLIRTGVTKKNSPTYMLRGAHLRRFSHRLSPPAAHCIPHSRRVLLSMAAAEESLAQEISEQSKLVAKLKSDSSAQAVAALEEAKRKLAELKKKENITKNAASGGKDAGKKKERLLLKTAKVRLQHHLWPLKVSPTVCLSRELGIMDQARCFVENT